MMALLAAGLVAPHRFSSAVRDSTMRERRDRAQTAAQRERALAAAEAKRARRRERNLRPWRAA
jgi:hypothetical protein